MGKQSPQKPGEKWKYKGHVFEFQGIERIKDERGEGDWYCFKSKTQSLKYPALRFFNDLYGGKIVRVE